MITAYGILLCIIAGSYLLGSIPFGLILAQLSGSGDIRKIGSGNIGATNVLRTGKKKLALLTLLLDMGKGAVTVLLTRLALPEFPHYFYYNVSFDSYLLAAAFFSILGHIFPIWLKFKGGKGVATAVGALLALDPRLGVACMLMWLAVFFITNYSSLSSILCFIGVIIMDSIALYIGGMKVQSDADAQLRLLFLIATTAIITYRHKENIQRLIKGEESKFYLKSKSSS